MIHGTRPCLPNYTKISPNFANQAHRTGCGRACGPHLSCYSSPRILPQIPPIHRLPRSSCRPHRAPASPPFPPAAAPQRLQIPPPLLHSHTGTRATSLLLLPHLSPAAPWELAISWISGRPVLGTMSGGQEDPEGSGDFDWSKLALSFILMRLLED